MTIYQNACKHIDRIARCSLVQIGQPRVATLKGLCPPRSAQPNSVLLPSRFAGRHCGRQPLRETWLQMDWSDILRMCQTHSALLAFWPPVSLCLCLSPSVSVRAACNQLTQISFRLYTSIRPLPISPAQPHLERRRDSAKSAVMLPSSGSIPPWGVHITHVQWPRPSGIGGIEIVAGVQSACHANQCSNPIQVSCCETKASSNLASRSGVP